MTFRVGVSRHLYESEDDVKQLAALGFEFEPYEYYSARFRLKVPDGEYEAYTTVELDSLEALADFVKVHGKVIVFRPDDDGMQRLEIYNGHRE